VDWNCRNHDFLHQPRILYIQNVSGRYVTVPRKPGEIVYNCWQYPRESYLSLHPTSTPLAFNKLLHGNQHRTALPFTSVHRASIFKMLALSARLLTLTAFALSVVANPVPEPADHPDWSQVFIRNPKYFGSGCPKGSVDPTLADDGSWLNLAFSKFEAQVYPGSIPSQSHKNCQLSFELHFPKGWSVTLFDTTISGFVKLDKRVTASEESTYHFGGNPQDTATFKCPRKGWVGALSKSFSCTDQLLLEAFVWSSCKGTYETLFINTQIDVDNDKNPKGSGFINIQSAESVVVDTWVHRYGCRWKRCH